MPSLPIGLRQLVESLKVYTLLGKLRTDGPHCLDSVGHGFVDIGSDGFSLAGEEFQLPRQSGFSHSGLTVDVEEKMCHFFRGLLQSLSECGLFLMAADQSASTPSPNQLLS
ncbi:hypothetical protein ACIA8R_03650 [Nonomuraea sp. NPDC051191]|uniref:hypothetical protein n=1 Tax=Nonomuraea sp. NPDC051191 TaxID=3364372 RepID=UPI0037971530